jgi:hypothetical protein
MHRFNSKSFDSKAFDLDFLNGKVILFDNFHLHVPFNYMIYLSRYLEYFRRFKYSAYIKSLSWLSKRPRVKAALLSYQHKTFNTSRDFSYDLFNKNIIFFRFYNASSNDQCLSVNLNNDFILSKLYLYFINYFSLKSIYNKFHNKQLISIYINRMYYRSFFQFRPYYKFFPKGKNFSLDSLAYKLRKCKLDPLTFTLHNFIISVCKEINYDMMNNVEYLTFNYNILDCIRFSQLVIMDYLAALYFRFFYTIDIDLRSKSKSKRFIYLLFELSEFFAFEFFDLPLHTVFQRRHLDLIIHCIFNKNIFLNLMNKVDIVFTRLSKSFYDLLLIHFLRLIKFKGDIYKYHTKNFVNDVAIKSLYNILHMTRKDHKSSTHYQRFFDRRLIKHVAARIDLSKRIYNFFIYF